MYNRTIDTRLGATYFYFCSTHTNNTTIKRARKITREDERIDVP